MAVVPFCTLALINRPEAGARPLVETVFAGLLAAAAFYIAVNEGAQNWQSLWTAAAYWLLGATLWQARSIVIARVTSIEPFVLVRGDDQCWDGSIQEPVSSVPRPL